VCFLLQAFLGGSLFAASWDDLRILKEGDRVLVEQTQGTTVKGSFRALAPDTITVATGRGETVVDRARVRQVNVRSGSRRIRNAVIGAGIGVAIGVLFDQTGGAYLRNETGQSSGARVASYLAPISVSAAIGGAFPAYRTIYRVR
jgi:hypothetical protein